MLPGLLPQLQVGVGTASGEQEQANANIFTGTAQRELDLDSLQDAHLKLQPVEDFYQVVHISQELMRSGDLLCILVGVILLQERQAIHVTVAQPLAVIPVAQTLPLTWEKRIDSFVDECRYTTRDLGFALTRWVPADVAGVSVWNVVF